MDIFQYIKSEENYYNTVPVPVNEGWEWSMPKHIKLTTLYLNSQYESGKEDDKPFKNIILPKVNLEHRAVEFALKEIEFFINDAHAYYKSFLVRKYHERWALQNGVSNTLDEITECYTDYGGVLLKKVKKDISVVPLQQIAFCDQTDIMSGPIGLKHSYSADQLLDMSSSGWGKPENGATMTLEELVAISTNSKTTTQVKGRQIQTPTRYTEVYEVHGMLPESFLDEKNEETKYTRQLHIVAFYQDENGEKQGVTLFKGREASNPFKFFKRDPIYGRALGRGAVEELFEPQVWVNYSEIQKKELLDAASKVVYQTADADFINKNNTTNVDNGDVWIHAPEMPLSQVNTSTPNVQAFENAAISWDETAKEIAAAGDTISGSDSKSGMPFRLGMLLNQESHSLHQYRKGKIGGIFLVEVYRDWIIPDIKADIVKGQEFLSTLSLDEMEELSRQVVDSMVNRHVIEKVVGDMSLIQPGELQQLADTYKTLFFQDGNKKFLEILKDELKDLELDVEVNITGEQQNKALMAEKLSSIFSQVAQNPQILDDPRMSKLFNEILEASGLSPLKYVAKAPVQVAQQPMNAQVPAPNAQPMQPLSMPVPQTQLTQ